MAIHPLVAYFGSGVFLADLNQKNALGSGGKVAIAFHKLLQMIWNHPLTQCQLTPPMLQPSVTLDDLSDLLRRYAGSIIADAITPDRLIRQTNWSFASHEPRTLRNVMGDFNYNFSGYQQQDSHEFLLSILDALHEDTNRVQNPPYLTRREGGTYLRKFLAALNSKFRTCS